VPSEMLMVLGLQLPAVVLARAGGCWLRRRQRRLRAGCARAPACLRWPSAGQTELETVRQRGCSWGCWCLCASLPAGLPRG